jgi:hypothetical protein
MPRTLSSLPSYKRFAGTPEVENHGYCSTNWCNLVGSLDA